MVLVVLSALVGAGCSAFNGEVTDDVPVSFSFPSTMSTPSTAPTTTTTLPDLTGVDLGQVRGDSTVVFPKANGNVVLGGQVVSPDGGVGSAIVHVERFIGDSGTSAEVRTDDRGNFRINGLSGGRYRVRAWRSPDFLMTEPTVFFVDASKATGEVVFADGTAIPASKLSLQVQHRGGLSASAAVSRRPFGLGEVVVLSIRVGAKQVDSEGSVTIGPFAGALVTLLNPGPWSFYNATQATSDGNGVVAFEASCGEYGTGSIQIDVNGAQLSVPTPRCGYPPTTTTSLAPETSVPDSSVSAPSVSDPSATSFSVVILTNEPQPPSTSIVIGTGATQTISQVP